MKEQTYWNHYKTHSDWKQRLIFFMIGGFYKTFESDAVLLSHLLGFQLSVQNGMKTVGFPINAGEKYFSLLKQADYAFVVLQMHES